MNESQTIPSMTTKQPTQSGQLAIGEAGAAHNHQEASNGLAPKLPFERETAPAETHNARRAQETAKGRLRQFDKPFPFPFKANRLPLPAFAGEGCLASQTPISLLGKGRLASAGPLVFPFSPFEIPFQPFKDDKGLTNATPVCLPETPPLGVIVPFAFPSNRSPSPFREVMAETAAVNQTPVCPQISAALGVLAKALVMAQKAFDKTAAASLTSSKGKGGAV